MWSSRWQKQPSIQVSGEAVFVFLVCLESELRKKEKASEWTRAQRCVHAANRQQYTRLCIALAYVNESASEKLDRGKTEAPAAARWFLLLLLFGELTAVPLKCCNYHPHKEAHKSAQKHERSVPSGGHHSHMISQCEAGCMNVNHPLWCLAGDDIYLQAKKKRKKTARRRQRLQDPKYLNVPTEWRFRRDEEQVHSQFFPGWLSTRPLWFGWISQLWHVHCA